MDKGHILNFDKISFPRECMNVKYNLIIFTCEYPIEAEFSLCSCRFMLRWQMRLPVLDQPPPTKATSTWMPSWKPFKRLVPKLWVWMCLKLIAGCLYIPQETAELVKGRISSSSLVPMTRAKLQAWLLLEIKGSVASGSACYWSCRWLQNSVVHTRE